MTNKTLLQENCTRFDVTPSKKIQDFTKKFKCSHNNSALVLIGGQNSDLLQYVTVSVFPCVNTTTSMNCANQSEIIKNLNYLDFDYIFMNKYINYTNAEQHIQTFY